MPTRRNFHSDNEAGVAPEILAALTRANDGMAYSYGADEISKRVRARFCELFEAELEIFPVVSGTAANALAIAQLAPPYGSVYCHEESHLNTDECGAPEHYSGGAKLVALRGEHARIAPDTLADALRRTGYLGDHECLPCALSVSEATEHGTVYTPAELAALSSVAKGRGLRVHMDGARFTNALAHLGVTPAELSWKAGVDLLSFGATKNGAMMAEALIVFDAALAHELGRRRKRAGHLLSKMRFVSAQLEAYVDDGLWLRLARHANAAAQAIASGVRAIDGVELVHPVQANEVFLRMPDVLAAGLREAGFDFYSWPRGDDCYRFVTAFDTPDGAVDGLLETLRRLAREAGGVTRRPAEGS
jgi:threonine aldolase